MFCQKCAEPSDFLHRDFCLPCLWKIVTPDSVRVIRVCKSCGLPKPVDLFKASDSTCNLCRKLLSLGKRYPVRLELSKTLILGGNYVTCKTCDKMFPADDFPQGSYDCVSCTSLRQLTEIIKVGGFYDDYMNCRGPCGESLLISSFSHGRLTCRRCINTRNSRGR